MKSVLLFFVKQLYMGGEGDFQPPRRDNGEAGAPEPRSSLFTMSDALWSDPGQEGAAALSITGPVHSLRSHGGKVSCAGKLRMPCVPSTVLRRADWVLEGPAR